MSDNPLFEYFEAENARLRAERETAALEAAARGISTDQRLFERAQERQRAARQPPEPPPAAAPPLPAESTRRERWDQWLEANPWYRGPGREVGYHDPPKWFR